MKIRSFRNAAALVIGVLVVLEIILGSVRNPMADRWVGKVELVTFSKVQKLDVTMTYEMLDPGFVMDKRPDVRNRGIRVTYEGPDVEVLRKLGIKDSMFASPERTVFSQGYCNLHIENKEGWTYTSYGKGPSIRMYAFHYMTKPKDPCDTFQLGVVDFNHLDYKILKPGQGQYSLSGFNEKDVVHVELERDSRVSFIQRVIMWARFNWWTDHPTFQKT